MFRLKHFSVNETFNNVRAKEKVVLLLTFVIVYLVPILIFTIYFSNRDIGTDDIDLTKHPANHSSVWCHMRPNSAKLCAFKNICYDPHLMSFLFFLGNLTVIKGFENYTEFQTIQLSSLSSHNNFFANISVVSVEDHKIKPGKPIGKGLLFSRFKPDNIMHVIHDDLIPLFLTLEDICLGNVAECVKDYTLVIHDNRPESSFFRLYELFSIKKPILLSRLHRNSGPLCFQELRMGLVTDSVFYQYGFGKLQGPVEDTKLSSHDLTRFSTFVNGNLNIKTERNNNSKTNIILVSRKKSRRILNAGDVVRMLTRAFESGSPRQRVEVTTLDLSETEIEVFLEKVSQASALVGMHGAEMIFSVFLEPNSTVVELFPFAVQPEVVSFVRPLAKLEGIRFRYLPWRNENRNGSVFRGAVHGDARRGTIADLDTLPAFECCDHPTYLRYMYQDTLVDSDFEAFLAESLETDARDGSRTGELRKWLFPSPVTEISCVRDSVSSQLHVSWRAPFGALTEALIYDLLLTEIDSEFGKNVVTENTHLSVDLSSREPYPKFRVWITAISEKTGSKSRDAFFECI